ncbi:MAG: hypothetical protein KatS3mg128_0254 [Silanimonas sp.]|nr:MAG: hypothetical protein KatS3mg128_0254 [Silanimonas sp.]
MCSDLSPRACATPPAAMRQPPRYRLDTEGLARASDPRLWQAPGAPSPARIAAMLETARQALGPAVEAAAGVSGEVLENALAAVCLTEHCAINDPHRPWSQLLDAERSAILAALELPSAEEAGERPRELAFPLDSRVEGGVAVLRAFVASAAKRSGTRPRIAIVTAAAFDPMAAVDFYRSLFDALGADAVWWPVDAALAEARFVEADCRALPRLRIERLGLSQRERIYPDLAAYQHDFCRSPPALMLQVQGVFFAGGDQWRLRQAFLHADGRANLWLQELQQAYAAGRVVVGGTSAGAAVQSGAWMLTNGSVQAAVARAARVAPPPEPGCGRAGRCGGMAEDQLALWPEGGLRLASGAIVDTHFSERARELRLLRALQASGAAWGYGADEASALHVKEWETRREIRALGEHGGWVLHRPPSSAADEAVAIAWYLVPGAVLVVENGEPRLMLEGETWRPLRPSRNDHASAFEAGAMRALAQRLAWRCRGGGRLPAGSAQAELRCLSDTLAWRGPAGRTGVGPLALRLTSAASASAQAASP